MVAWLLGLLAAPADAGPCRRHELQPVVLTRSTTKLPSDGAVIVIQDSVIVPNLPEQPTVWRVKSGAAVAAKHSELAPGMWRYSLPADALALENDVWKYKIERTASPASPLEAPKVLRLVERIPNPRKRGVSIDAELDGTAPTGALAIVIADAKTKQPRSWGYANGPLVRPYAQGPCDTHAPGTVATTKGDEVILYWVDHAGRISPPTAALRVK